MSREIAGRFHTRRQHIVVQSGGHRRNVNAISADLSVQVIVRVCLVAELESRQSYGSPVPTDSAERKLAVFPLAAHVAVFSAPCNLPVLPPLELRIMVQPIVEQRTYRC